MDVAAINQLLVNPGESLAVELKSWLDPMKAPEAARIARALIALHNNNGGVLVLGIDDKLRTPVTAGRPADVGCTYHPDIVQGLVKKHCEPAFEVTVLLGERDNLKFPAIAVPAGVRLPVIARQQVVDLGHQNKTVLRQHAVYVRSVHNGVVESVEPRSPEDWQTLL